VRSLERRLGATFIHRLKKLGTSMAPWGMLLKTVVEKEYLEAIFDEELNGTILLLLWCLVQKRPCTRALASIVYDLRVYLDQLRGNGLQCYSTDYYIWMHCLIENQTMLLCGY